MIVLIVVNVLLVIVLSVELVMLAQVTNRIIAAHEAIQESLERQEQYL